MAYVDWLRGFKQLAESGGREADGACPECGLSGLDFQYIGDAKTRIGYPRIWCRACRKGVHLSRVTIPETVPMLSFDAPKENLDRCQPAFEELEP